MEKPLSIEYKGTHWVTPLPLGLGFGVKEKSDIDYLKGKVDIAVINQGREKRGRR